MSTTATILDMIKVWAKITGNEPEKVQIQADADIDDLKNELFDGNKVKKRQYYGMFNNKRLSSSTRIPHNTTCEQPILFFKIDENDHENDMDVTRVIVTDLNTVLPNENVLNTTFTIPSVQNEMELKTTKTIKADHVAPHLVDTIHYKNGDKYVGETNAQREPHGKGTMYWKNGRRYEGYWKNGKKDGQGVEYGANGAVNIIGEWKDDVIISSHNNDDQ
ncbi:unnamed protein product [Rotaria sordida]|uniref:Uncharacterized protein n=1 Tax=Rotaria sordida TaxID=392033 RepID=A0A820B2I2_9BILA|nr:unnamed protein product [Rotaria sordida]CAF1510646.1 unnamed protein product [Rotaria sordida]CAF1549186.1 unnamed protein product [Rotaria sordida]CAF3911832.1 unnamed protein product [Rotaria sordida]CAF4127543.1 unnamed protein product [Rotaria sordida]